MTAWRRLRDWQRAGVWEKPHQLLLAELHTADQVEWERAVDSSHAQAKKGAPRRGRARSSGAAWGASTTLLVDGGGILLAWTLTGGNRNDVTQLELLDRVPPVRIAARDVDCAC